MHPESHRFEPAARRFKDFFDELDGAFAERGDVLRQIALALLAREHVLVCGPPGTAKSQLASAVFGRIVDETTGRASLYSRQIGESTVRTDLVGPIDFKTLMETGRSEHFTDEGMLGAVHAFLDEVFDGRDMLLRDALNVLQERELKQGNRVVTGRIECALMTSNRYLVEVLEGSRDTLLAFVDRIAFAGFVPRGFADDAAMTTVLKRHVAGTGFVSLLAPLSVQDIDALQATCETVVVSEAICERLALLLARFDAELLAASRADPSFHPTRYVSTRTAVRAGKLLRAIAVHRTIFGAADEPLVVQPDDLRMLYLHLALSGPDIAVVDKLIANERDPRERRQLTILQTERMLFDRALASLPKATMVEKARARRASAVPPKAGGDATAPGVPLASGETIARLSAPLASHVPATVVDGIKAIVNATREQRISSSAADALLDRAKGSLNALAIATTVRPTNESHASAEDVATSFATFADQLDAVGIAAQPIARFLRGRAVAVLDESYRVAPTPGGEDPFGLSSESPPPLDRARARLDALRARALRRERLVAKGAELPPGANEAWLATLELAERELVVLWDHAVSTRLKKPFEGAVDEVAILMRSLRPVLVELDGVEKRLREFGRGERFRVHVLGPRMREILRSLFAGRGGMQRKAVVEAIAAMQRLMLESDVADIVDPIDWVEVTANALLASEIAHALPPGTEPSADAYDALRRGEHRISNTVTLAEVALHSSPAFGAGGLGPETAELRVAEVLASLPVELRARVVGHDLARVDRAVSLLEAWWTKLGGADASTSDLRHSKFVKVVWEDGALLRFALEGRAIATLFVASKVEAEALVARVEALHAAVRGRVDVLQRARTDAAWAAVLGRDVGP